MKQVSPAAMDSMAAGRLHSLSFLPERVLTHIDPDPGSDHLLWTGWASEYGYARVMGPDECIDPALERWTPHRVGDNKHVSLARWVLTITRGPAPGYTVSHDCHDRDLDCPASLPHFCYHRLCVNPDHLSWKSMRENLLSSPRTAASRKLKARCTRSLQWETARLSTYPRLDPIYGNL